MRGVVQPRDVQVRLLVLVTSRFLKRKVTDRPDVVPKGLTNLALTGQFVEVPDDCVFTMQ